MGSETNTTGSPAAPPCTVYLVRHAEKNGDALTSTGLVQAEKLALLLENAGITAIFTTQFKRTEQTAAPLLRLLANRGVHVRTGQFPISDELLAALQADRLNQQVGALLAKYGDAAALVLRRDCSDAIVLIVGHDATVPAIIRSMGYLGEATIGPTDFDRLFVVTPERSGDNLVRGVLYIAHYAP